MDNRHNEYLDRIINFLVDDTNVDQKNKTWYPPFPTPHPHPMFKTFFNLISMAEILGPRFLMDNVYVQNFRTYFRDTYGISLGDKEFKDLWLKYLYTIKPKINGFTINESVDRKYEYLNKIVDFLVQDTVIDYKNDRIEGPFPILSSFSYLPFDRYVIDYFSKYCEDTYGLTEDEIQYVWYKYKNKIVNKKPIKESMDNRMTKDEYLNKIVNYLVDDTELYYDEKLWSPPFEHPTFLPPYPVFLLRPELPFYKTYKNYFKDTYGLKRNKDMDYVWNEYRNIIIDKLNNPININESNDRITRDEYLNKVINYLVDDTIIDYENNVVNAPFRGLQSSHHLPLYHFLPSVSTFLANISYPITHYSTFFTIYCIDTYGLTDEEVDYVWDEYKTMVIDKINSHGNINESVDRKQDYLDKIVNYILDDTIINYNTDIIKFPFSSIGPLGRPLPSFISDGLDSISFYSFHKYCKETYGLTDEECKIVWERYMKKLYQSYG